MFKDFFKKYKFSFSLFLFNIPLILIYLHFLIKIDFSSLPCSNICLIIFTLICSILTFIFLGKSLYLEYERFEKDKKDDNK